MSIYGQNLTNKPAVAVAPSPATDTLVTQQNQGITDAQATTSTKAVNQSGIKMMTGGVELSMGFFEACYASFNNLLSYQPLALALFLIAFLYYTTHLLTYQTTHSPFVLMHAAVNTTHNKTTSTLGKSFVGFFLMILVFMKKYQDLFALISAFAYPYFCKPSSRNAQIGALLFCFCFLSDVQPAGVLGLSTCFFLMAELRSPQHKSIVVLIAIVSVIIGNGLISKIAIGK